MKLQHIAKEILAISICLLTLQACNNDSVMYEEGARIYFPVDSMHYSFGDKALNYTQHTFEFPVRILGDISKQTRKFKVTLDASKTTAEAGKHYKALSAEYEVAIDSVNTVIPIELYREKLGDTEEYLLTLKLEANDDFELGVRESLTAVFAFGNVLLEPKWWSSCKRYVGPYHPAKYQKFIEIHGEALPDKYSSYNDRKMYYLSIFKQVKTYFEENPQEGVFFPDVTWPL